MGFAPTVSRLQVGGFAVKLRWRDAPGRLKPPLSIGGKPLPGDWQTHCHDCRFFLLGTAGEVWLSPMESLAPRLADYASNCHDRCILLRRSRCPCHRGQRFMPVFFQPPPHSANVRTGFSDPCITGSHALLCCCVAHTAVGIVRFRWWECLPQALFSA